MSSMEHVVIVGAGIIGSTTAFYLSRASVRPAKITLIEASARGPAQGASGKAGGLIARWAYPEEIVKVSFDEHVRLAEELDGVNRWGFRYVNCGSWTGSGTTDAINKGALSLEKTKGLENTPKNAKSKRPSQLPPDLNWVRQSQTTRYMPMAEPRDSAQVYPDSFTRSMAELALANGVKLVQGKVTSVDISDGAVTGVSYEDKQTGTAKRIEDATKVLVTAGAWTPKLLPDLPISPMRAHSITIQPPRLATVGPYVLFTDIKLPSGNVSPEMYARPNNQVYICGPGDKHPLPETVDEVEVDQEACDDLVLQVRGISDVLADGVVDKRQACYLPNGGPIIGQMPNVKGLYVGSGHTCWGICNAPGTAKILTELITEGKATCVNICQFSPSDYVH